MHKQQLRRVSILSWALLIGGCSGDADNSQAESKRDQAIAESTAVGGSPTEVDEPTSAAQLRDAVSDLEPADEEPTDGVEEHTDTREEPAVEDPDPLSGAVEPFTAPAARFCGTFDNQGKLGDDFDSALAALNVLRDVRDFPIVLESTPAGEVFDADGTLIDLEFWTVRVLREDNGTLATNLSDIIDERGNHYLIKWCPEGQPVTPPSPVAKSGVRTFLAPTR